MSYIIPGGLLDQGPDSMGGRARLGPTALAGGVFERTILRLTAERSNRPQTIVLSFSLVNATTPPAVSNHRVVARVQWGSLKSQQAALFDVRYGLRTTLEGTSLAVDVFYFAGTVDALVGPDVDVSCSVGAGSVGKAPSLVLTALQTTIAVGAAADFVVPATARQVEIQSTADPSIAVPTTFVVHQRAGTAVGSRLVSMSLARDTPITLLNGVDIVRIQNLGPAQEDFTPIFHLAL